MFVASMFAISFIQQAAAQGNQIGSANQSSAVGVQQLIVIRLVAAQ
jgi:hypothetical protein